MQVTGAPDPFTGGQAYTTASCSSVESTRTQYFPQINYLQFGQGNTQVILDKMRELNMKAISGSEGGLDETLLEGVVKLATENCNDELHIDILIQILNWPPG